MARKGGSKLYIKRSNSMASGRVECSCGSRESCKIGYTSLLCTSDHPRNTFPNSYSFFSSFVTIHQLALDKKLLDKGVCKAKFFFGKLRIKKGKFRLRLRVYP